MASRGDKKVADATTKLGGTIARAVRSWAEEIGADDFASDVMDRVYEGFDAVLDRAKEAAGKARARSGRTAKKASKKVRTAAKRKTKTPTKKKKTVRKKA